ncbi:MAG: metallophosphoesterase family protein [Trueperaceae bacterium]
MAILELETKPFHRIQFMNAGKRGGTVSEMLPLLRGRVDKLPDGLEALLLTSDLQGVVNVWQPRGTRLLGEALATEYAMLAEEGTVPWPEKTGVILAGDFYSAPGGDERGASGDVRAVWQAFAERFRWVVGVEGNHDRFGTSKERDALMRLPNVHLLENDVVKLDNIVIAGVSGIIGDPSKPARRDEVEFVAALELVLEESPDILILHQGPNGHKQQRGSDLVREILLLQPPKLTVCGHVHWEEPLARMGEDSQVLNVDSRAVLLTL